MDGIVGYREIREQFLGCYYSYCREKLQHHSPWVAGESEVGYAYEELEGTFDRPIENLMLEVIALMLRAGRGGNAMEYHLSAIDRILKANDINNMACDLSDEDKGDFFADLQILGLIDRYQR
ncbi:hypothetical protein RAS12_08910 [Achromobacter seleniivolatilans]|uniref:Uncharacterized protein n=1 Tax=Achromobacter seleniivolatilans TaxID=3047478 RepID=A0ABY9M730_9BURK|nr:hypothetical protein [Achromobacter sp. R39]WMD22482.1 hypothetical protein RAS12_08910 [Achromobacter sp. R39]